MADNKLGITELVDTAVDIIEGTDALVTAFSDGIQITDAAVLFSIAPKVQEIAKDGRRAVDELLDLTPDEADEAAFEIARRTGKNPNGIINRVNEGFALCARTYRLYTTGRNLGFDWQRYAKSWQRADSTPIA
jgi:hypothetical protein